MIRRQKKANWKRFKDPSGSGAWWYCWGKLVVCVSDPKVVGCHHISIAHPDRPPTWDEVYTARYDLMPENIKCGIILPNRSNHLPPKQFHIFEWQS
jgi:hypothetical protein